MCPTQLLVTERIKESHVCIFPTLIKFYINSAEIFFDGSIFHKFLLSLEKNLILALLISKPALQQCEVISGLFRNGNGALEIQLKCIMCKDFLSTIKDTFHTSFSRFACCVMTASLSRSWTCNFSFAWMRSSTSWSRSLACSSRNCREDRS